MPATTVLFYKDEDGRAPVLDWLLDLNQRNPRAFRKCFEVIRLLELQGYELRRPRADMLRDGVYELRTRVGNVNYRILYGFVGKNVALLTAGLTKEKEVPSAEIEQAIARIQNYKANPGVQSFVYVDIEPEEADDGKND